MPLSSRSRRLLSVAVVVVAVIGGGVVAVRFWLGGYMVRTVLQMAGATEIRYQAVRGTPWHFEVEALGFQIDGQRGFACRVVLARMGWWRRSPGAVRVVGAAMPVYLDGSEIEPVNWSVDGRGLGDGESVNLPLTTLDLDGRIIVRMAALPDMPIEIKLEGKPKGDVSWIGSLVAQGPGFRLAGSGSLLRAGQELEFQVHSSELDCGVWSRHIQRQVVLPGAPWQLKGKLTAVAEGNVTAKRFAATARVSLRDGGMKVLTRDIEVTDAEADLEFSDLWKYRTKAGELRLGELRVGRLAVRDVIASFGLWGSQTVLVNAAHGSAFGGTISAAPFRYLRGQRELMLQTEGLGLDAAQMLALVPEVPAQLDGKFDVRVPLRIQSAGVRFEPGAVTLAPGTKGAMQLDAKALLRSGEKLDEASVRVLRAAEEKPLRLRLNAFQLNIRPNDLPLGCSARIVFSGETETGPVAATLHVNGSI